MFAKLRNTSAYAEKTALYMIRLLSIWKHLRLRGENSLKHQPAKVRLETPPLTRRKRIGSSCSDLKGGNTSAYAEKTGLYRLRALRNRKHLRLRGENATPWTAQTMIEETPPLTRRKLRVISLWIPICGNTSAYAEKTLKKSLTPL